MYPLVAKTTQEIHMTYQPDCTLPEELLEQIAADGLEALPGLIRILVNEAMRLEREQHLGEGGGNTLTPNPSPVNRRGAFVGFDSGDHYKIMDLTNEG
jgi:hypothetical protein